DPPSPRHCDRRMRSGARPAAADGTRLRRGRRQRRLARLARGRAYGRAPIERVRRIGAPIRMERIGGLVFGIREGPTRRTGPRSQRGARGVALRLRSGASTAPPDRAVRDRSALATAPRSPRGRVPGPRTLADRWRFRSAGRPAPRRRVRSRPRGGTRHPPASRRQRRAARQIGRRHRALAIDRRARGACRVRPRGGRDQPADAKRGADRRRRPAGRGGARRARRRRRGDHATGRSDRRGQGMRASARRGRGAREADRVARTAPRQREISRAGAGAGGRQRPRHSRRDEGEARATARQGANAVRMTRRPSTGAPQRALRSAATLAIVVAAFACASAGAVPGGPEDHAPPQIATITPDSGQVNVHPKQVDFRFDETVNDRPSGASTLDQLFLISPRSGGVDVSWHRSRISVRPNKGFRPNTAYRVTMLPGLADLRGNVRKVGLTMLFSTGPTFPPFNIVGHVFDWAAQRAAVGAYVEAVAHPDTSVVYLGATDSTGQFE